jgi:hypothetical protein
MEIDIAGAFNDGRRDARGQSVKIFIAAIIEQVNEAIGDDIRAIEQHRSIDDIDIGSLAPFPLAPPPRLEFEVNYSRSNSADFIHGRRLAVFDGTDSRLCPARTPPSEAPDQFLSGAQLEAPLSQVMVAAGHQPTDPK